MAKYVFATLSVILAIVYFIMGIAMLSGYTLTITSAVGAGITFLATGVLLLVAQYS